MTNPREPAETSDSTHDTSDSAAADGDDGRTVLVVGADDAADAAATVLDRRGTVIRRPESDEPPEASDADCAVLSEASVGLSSPTFDALCDRLPVVFLGAPTDETTAAEALSAGAAEFVPPADAADGRVLDARVSGVVARARRDRLAADLARERSMLDAIFETIPAHLYVKDEEARHLRVSEAYLDDPTAYIGRTDDEIHSHGHAEETHADDRRVIDRGEPILDKEERVMSSDTDEFSVRHLLSEHGEEADVSESWVLTSKVPWRDDDGEILGLVGFTIDISERNEYRKRLERQNDRLEEFARVVSHDLRNPLNVAQGYLELLADIVEDETAAAYTDRIDGAHGRMNELIEDVLSLARRGEVVDDPEPTALAAAAASAWEAVAPAGELDVRTGAATVLADEGRLRALLENLFSNAEEHGRDERAVTVTVGLLDGGDGFYVADDGPGVPESDRERAFEPGQTTAEDGTGFGLVIVRRIAEAHGWSVSVTDAATGGARFEFHGCDVRTD
ncbi:PAS domain S-box-containing protein [Halopelagius inordinatus]|uniref:histidine kinase n=1 Tax=Halopelagius inordinatus TaxID=553467 RepID=A0A1I2SGG2_9EURY|nr:PAS domain-containing sensor histidine kinase [Halopelagius inordinatus]SFG49226.1 PAS domain S-box-containing protein [Halopelagius inordinatus]